MFAVFAAAASASSSAPGSDPRRRLTIDLYPSFLISGTAAGVVAPAHAIVVSTLEKFLTPSSVPFVTCAERLATAIVKAAAHAPIVRPFMIVLPGLCSWMRLDD